MQTELVERARCGDREAFGVLAVGAAGRLYATARVILRDAELAEDATQDALVKAWRNLPSLRDVERFEPWLRRLLVRSCSDVANSRRRWRDAIALLPREPAQTDGSTDLADRDQIERGLQRLTDAHRTILVLFFYLDLAPTEVAEALGIPVGTARSRLHYAIDALRAALAADDRARVGAEGVERLA